MFSDLLPPPPPAENATASKDQAGQASTHDGTGDCQESPHLARLSALDTLLDAAMIFPVNKIPISTVIEGRGLKRW